MGTAFVSFGCNLGDVAATFDQAAELLADRCGEVVRLSSLYSSGAVGADAGGMFLNAVAEVETFHTPIQLLDVLLKIETELGRERTVHWGPRTIDLDLVLYEDLVMATDRLVLPHPRFWYRKFILDPLSEIAGDVLHPERAVSVAKLTAAANRRPATVAVTSPDSRQGQRLMRFVNERFADADAEPWDPDDNSPAIVVWHADSQAKLADLPQATRLDLTSEPGEPTTALQYVLESLGLPMEQD